MQLPQPDPSVAGLAHAIQLALAPVFLLSGIAALLGVLTQRLARVIDRARRIEEKAIESNSREAVELLVLRERVRRVNGAITLCTYAALMIAGVVATLFLGAVARVDVALVVAAAFVLAMLALIAGLTSFLREIHIATRHYREERRNASIPGT